MACDPLQAESPKSTCFDSPLWDSSTLYSSTSVEEGVDSSQLSYHAMGLPGFDNEDDIFFMHKRDSFLSLQNRSNRYG